MANCLALSRLICLPSGNEAVNWFSIEDSKFNNDSEILSTAPNSNPNYLAAILALSIFIPPSLANLAKN